MQYHTENATQLPQTIVLPDDGSSLVSCVVAKLEALGYLEVVETDPPETDDFELLSVLYDEFDDGGKAKYRKTYVKENASVPFHPWVVVGRLSSSKGSDACSAIASLLDDPDFFKWMLSSPSYTRGETNSEKLAAACGRDAVETAIKGA